LSWQEISLNNNTTQASGEEPIYPDKTQKKEKAKTEAGKG
jgi:hypothetical protein